MRDLLSLFLIFFKLGLFTFGGGYAMIPTIKEIIIEKKKWITEDELLDIIAISESTPGPIAINLATYIGYAKKGFLGSIFSTLGVSLPSLIIIFVISLFFKQFMELKYVTYAFKGIKCAVAVLIIFAGIDMLKKSKKNIFNYFIVILVFLLMIIFELFGGISSIFLILIGGIIGIMITALSKRKELWYILNYF